MPQFSVNHIHNIELDHAEYTAITDHFPNNRCTLLKLKEKVTFTKVTMFFFLLIINESKWKYQITLCIKENFPSYGIYKTVTTSNEIFPSDPLSSGKKNLDPRMNYLHYASCPSWSWKSLILYAICFCFFVKTYRCG